MNKLPRSKPALSADRLTRYSGTSPEEFVSLSHSSEKCAGRYSASRNKGLSLRNTKKSIIRKMAVEIIREKTKEFNQLATHPLQSWEWGEFRKSLGQTVIRFGEKKEGKLVSVFQVSFHKIPATPYTVGYLPKSSLFSAEVKKTLEKIGKENRAIFIKVEPNEEKTPQAERKIAKLGLTFGRSLFTKYTSIVDLNRSEEEILKSFKPKTRYNIKLAQKKGVLVEENNSQEAFEKYLDLLFETTRRQGFFAHNKEFHRKQWQILRPAGISHLLTATYQGEMLAAFLLFVFNKVLYYPYGASTREHKELMAPSLLMWEAIKFGKSQGCRFFDLWGDLPNPLVTHPYYGFHRFKEGFSPKLVEFLGSYDLVINPTLYQIYKIIDKIRWKLLRLKKKLF